MVPEITAVSKPNKSPPSAATTEMRMTYPFIVKFIAPSKPPPKGEA
jgi:hypothetical protein